MQQLLLLVILFNEEEGSVHSINGFTTRRKAALIVGEQDDLANSSIEDSLKELYVRRNKRVPL